MKQQLRAINNRPMFHFTAKSGWINDPNGLVFSNGTYHLYFQYNPYGIEWGNMSWGHAVSKDLLHWKQMDTVMYPDEDGMIFSGSGIKNEKELLELPKDALIFFFTSAGKNFTQKIAYSMDGGNTLIKIKEPCLVNKFKEDRDPKVFWHEESQAYIMVLWLKENDFGIFRSVDLKNWVQSDQITLQDSWECPDLICLYNERGEKEWAFSCADGYYFWGTFNGYQFTTDYKKHEMYFNKNLYAAQTYSGIENRVVFIPWLRLENNGEEYTGAMGIPRELKIRYKGEEKYIAQQPVKEWYEQLEEVSEVDKECIVYQIDFYLKNELDKFDIIIEEINISYHRKEGMISINNTNYKSLSYIDKLSFLVDNNVLEIFLDDGVQVGALKLDNKKISLNRFLSLTNENYFSRIIYASRM